MAFTRFQGQRGGTIKLDVKFYKDAGGGPILTDPLSTVATMTIDLLQSDSDTYINGLYQLNHDWSASAINMSGLQVTKDGTGLFSYTFQTLSGMSVGNYVDRWNGIQLSAGSDVVSGVYGFTVLNNTDDLSDWDVIPG